MALGLTKTEIVRQVEQLLDKTDDFLKKIPPGPACPASPETIHAAVYHSIEAHRAVSQANGLLMSMRDETDKVWGATQKRIDRLEGRVLYTNHQVQRASLIRNCIQTSLIAAADARDFYDRGVDEGIDMGVRRRGRPSTDPTPGLVLMGIGIVASFVNRR
jgi:hypothetical protein